MTAAQHHDAVIVLASVAIGIAFAAIVALPLLALLPKRRPAPPAVQPRVEAVPPLRPSAVYVITSLRPRPVDVDATVLIPRQGGRHAAR